MYIAGVAVVSEASDRAAATNGHPPGVERSSIACDQLSGNQGDRRRRSAAAATERTDEATATFTEPAFNL